ncbi:sensor histidine kinase [Virgisporangium aliadipatigenens]|uniref:sensor histidine kinase n=1 Tax=Virgisporangium aliadipatigenens TaxID=741659 RepID=UPI00194137B5|nr:nitrate- and nitrite sensing domain-containing protein [Virgisporangium aliadipatigenens]
MSASPPPPATQSSRRRSLRGWRVRTKLAALLVVPALAFTVVAGVQIVSSVRAGSQLSASAEHMALAPKMVTLLHAVQDERDRVAGESATGVLGDQFDAALAGSQRTVDEAYTRLEQSVARSAEPLRREFGQVSVAFLELRDTRRAARAGSLRPQAVFDSYSRAANTLVDMLPDPSGAPDPKLSMAAHALASATGAERSASQLRGLVFAATRSKVVQPGDHQQFTFLVAEQRSALDRVREWLPPATTAPLSNPSIAVPMTTLRDQVLEEARLGTITVDPDAWWSTSTAELDAFRSVQLTAVRDATLTAAKLRDGQHRRTMWLVGLILLVLCVTSLSSVHVGRSIIRSLRELRAQALDVAHQRLPEAISLLREVERPDDLQHVPTAAFTSLGGGEEDGDEISEVADAFAAVHASALALAMEQATLRRDVNAVITSLARRSQALVDRQLRLLDEIEAAEEDPDQLANLFRLDHLATRMRRNGENLLVLTAADTRRQRPEPVPLAAVVLAAMAEIEHYERVRSDIDRGGYIVGHAVVDVVHLISELLDNATQFSPPDTEVTVLGRISGDGTEATLLIEDSGLGMGEAELALANQRVCQSARVDASTAERMGLLVVGRLATRHDIRVRLRALSTGVEAKITLPAHLLAAPPARPYAALANSVVRRSMAHLLGLPPAPPEPEPTHPRSTPTRAEDVLDKDGSYGWWSPQTKATPRVAEEPSTENPDDHVDEPAAPVEEPAPIEENEGTPAPASDVSMRKKESNVRRLPTRVPMAHLPKTPATSPDAPTVEITPKDLSNVLVKFYNGVHRASAEHPEET